MSHPFDPEGRLIVVPTRLWGPTGETVARLALDTGASRSLVNRDILQLIGYDLSHATEQVRITTGSGEESVPLHTLQQLEALGQQRLDFVVLCHTLPLSASVNGLLGLDFFRGHRLTLDFRAGLVELE